MPANTPFLVLVRHGVSEYNQKGLWTGLLDIPLNDQGFKDAQKSAQAIKDIKFDKAYTSKLIRAKQTLEIILRKLSLSIPVTESEALNERDYGIYTGKNKWEIKKQLGEKEFQKLRRDWDYPIPKGETMETVYNRVVPFYKNQILKDLLDGQNILVSAHGNSLRALVKYLENLDNEKFRNLEFGIVEAYIYTLNNQGQIIKKEIRAENVKKGQI